MVLLGSVFLASLLGSLHCIGMCGGLVVLYAGEQSNSWVKHLTYSLGRLLSYVSVGLLAGSVGEFLGGTSILFGIFQWAQVLASILLIVWGGVTLMQLSGQGSFSMHLQMPSWFQVRLQSLHHKIMTKPPLIRAFLLGLFTTFLPCGWLYAFALTAITTGSTWHGMLVMIAFWAGTLPAMVGFGFGIQKLSSSFRQRIPTISAIAIVAIGVFTLIQRKGNPSLHQFHNKVTSIQSQKKQNKKQVLPKKPLSSCCQHKK